MGLKITLKLVALLMSIWCFIDYKKTNKLDDLINYWGCVLLAILF